MGGIFWAEKSDVIGKKTSRDEASFFSVTAAVKK